MTPTLSDEASQRTPSAVCVTVVQAMPCGTDGAVVSGAGSGAGTSHAQRRRRSACTLSDSLPAASIGRDATRVARAAREADGGEGPGARRPEPRAAAVHAVAGDAAVVGRGAPARRRAWSASATTTSGSSAPSGAACPYAPSRRLWRGTGAGGLLDGSGAWPPPRHRDLLAGSRPARHAGTDEPRTEDLQPVAALAAVDAEARALGDDHDAIRAAAAVDAVTLARLHPVGAGAARDPIGAGRADQPVGARGAVAPQRPGRARHT